MRLKTKNEIRSKVRLLYGLTYVLREHIDDLRVDARNPDIDQLYALVRETNETLERIIDILADIEYTIFLETNKGSH